MAVSLDGYIVGPDGGFDWTAPDEEVFRFATEEIRQVGVHLLGRRLYETMLYWETAGHRVPDRSRSYSQKRSRWPDYVAYLHAKYCYPVALIVVTPQEDTARWARKPIDVELPGLAPP